MNGKVYRLVNCVDNEEYVGSTCMPLAKRLYFHKDRAKRDTSRRAYEHLNEVGWDNVDIVLVEEYACDNKMELERRERYWIETLKATLNMRVPTRTDKEYRAENADKERERQAKYYANNADKVRETQAKYRAENADKVGERHAEYYANNSDKVRETQAKYRAENADKERERHAKYREANLDMIRTSDRERCKKYRDANREAVNARAQQRRANKKAKREAQQAS